MLPLIPLALSIAPELARWLFGDTAEATTAAVSSAITRVTGAPDMAAAQAVLARDPQVAAALRVELARIASEAEAGSRQVDLGTMQALKDVADAQSRALMSAQAHGAIQFAPVVISAMVLVTFGGVMWAALTRVLPDGLHAELPILLGTLAAMATSVVSYWVGSSAGSASKTQMLFRVATNQATPPP